MERQHVELEDRGDLGEVLGAAPDLAGAGQEHEHIAVIASGGFLLADAPHRRGDALAERAIVGLLLVLDVDLERATFRVHDGRIVQELRDRRGVERGRHRDELQLALASAPQPHEQREREVAVEVTLVQLVDDHAADAAQLGIGEQPAGQDALGHEPDPRRAARLPIEPHLVADLAAELDPALARHACRREPRGEPARLPARRSRR